MFKFSKMYEIYNTTFKEETYFTEVLQSCNFLQVSVKCNRIYFEKSNLPFTMLSLKEVVRLIDFCQVYEIKLR